MKLETAFKSRKLIIDYSKEGVKKIQHITLGSLNKKLSDDQLIQVVQAITSLIDGGYMGFSLTEVLTGDIMDENGDLVVNKNQD